MAETYRYADRQTDIQTDRQTAAIRPHGKEESVLSTEDSAGTHRQHWNVAFDTDIDPFLFCSAVFCCTDGWFFALWGLREYSSPTPPPLNPRCPNSNPKGGSKVVDYEVLRMFVTKGVTRQRDRVCDWRKIWGVQSPEIGEMRSGPSPKARVLLPHVPRSTPTLLFGGNMSCSWREPGEDVCNATTVHIIACLGMYRKACPPCLCTLGNLCPAQRCCCSQSRGCPAVAAW